jgi:hypothetical protein
MKKRLLLIFAVGISFSPSVFAEGTGNAFNKSHVAGQIYCKVLDGDKGDVPDSGDSVPAQQNKSVGAGVTLSQNALTSVPQTTN